MRNYNSDANSRPPADDAVMAGWDAERVRESIQRFMAARDLNVNNWSTRAAISANTLRRFLARKSHTMTHATLEKLAQAEKVTIDTMTGGAVKEESATTPPLDRELLTSVVLMVEDYLVKNGLALAAGPKSDTILAIYDLARDSGKRKVAFGQRQYENVIDLAARRP